MAEKEIKDMTIEELGDEIYSILKEYDFFVNEKDPRLPRLARLIQTKLGKERPEAFKS